MAVVPLAVAPRAARSAADARTGPGREVRLCAPWTFTAFGVVWRGAGAAVEARVRTGSTRADLGRAVVLEADPAEGPDAGSPEARRARRASDLLWVGSARCVGVTLRGPVEEPRAVFIDSRGSARAVRSEARAARPGVPRPEIVTRRMWGARRALRNCPPSYARRIRMGFVHHTAGSNDYTRRESDDVVRAIYSYHASVRGWCDIGYNFLVDRFGTIYQGRAGGMTSPVVPAAQQGFNRGAFAVSLIGNFERRRPPRAALRALRRVLAWRLDVAHVPADGRARMRSTGGPNTRYAAGRRVLLPALAGHRHTGLTACPGDRLFARLRRLRAATAAYGGPKILRPRLSADAFAPGFEFVVARARANVALEWTLTITSPDGVVVRSVTRAGERLRFAWPGTGAEGATVTPGVYLVTIEGRSADGDEARPARLEVLVR